MADYTHQVIPMTEVIVGMDYGLPRSDQTTFVRMRRGADMVMILDDPLNDRPVTEEMKRNFIKWFEQHIADRYEAALRGSFRISESPPAYLTHAILREMRRKMPPKDRGTYLDTPRPRRGGPWYRQSDRQLNGRRR